MNKGDSVTIILPKDPIFNNEVDIDVHIKLQLVDFKNSIQQEKKTFFSPRLENEKG